MIDRVCTYEIDECMKRKIGKVKNLHESKVLGNFCFWVINKHEIIYLHESKVLSSLIYVFRHGFWMSWYISHISSMKCEIHSFFRISFKLFSLQNISQQTQEYTNDGWNNFSYSIMTIIIINQYVFLYIA